MKGNTLTEFIDDLLTMGGPEKEYEYHEKNICWSANPMRKIPLKSSWLFSNALVMKTIFLDVTEKL